MLVRLPHPGEPPGPYEKPHEIRESLTFRAPRGVLNSPASGKDGGRNGTVRAMIPRLVCRSRFPEGSITRERAAASPSEHRSANRSGGVGRIACRALCPAEGGRDAQPPGCCRRAPPAAFPRLGRAATWLVALCIVASSAGCVPDPGFARSGPRHPQRLQGRRIDRPRRAADAGLVARLPLAGTDRADGGSPDGQSRHRRRRRAVRPGRRAGAHRGRGTAAERQRQRPGDLFPDLGLQRQRLEQWRARGGQLFGLAQRQLSTRFLGPEPRRPAGGGGDGDRQPLRSRRGGADHAHRRRQCLFSGARLAGPDPHRRAQYRQRHAHPRCDQAAAEGRHRHRPRRRAAGKRARQSEGIGSAAAANAGPEHQRAGDAGVAAAGKPSTLPADRSIRLPRRASPPACRRSC